MTKIFQIKYFVFFIAFLLTINSKSQDVTKPSEQHYIQSIEDFNGTYKSEKSGCFMSLIISDLTYSIQTEHHKVKGKLKIDSVNQTVLFQFKNVFKDRVENDITAELMDDYLVIQNYGNSLNNYTLFSECDSKYIELKKI